MQTPRPHQLEASNATHAALEKADRTTVTMACGTGKTKLQTMLVDLVDSKNGSIVVFAPTLLLINQLLSAWTRETNIPFSHFVVICSDRKTGIIDDVDISEIEDTKVSVAQNKTELEKFYKDKAGITVALCTYSSTEVLTKFHYDLGIFDESHKTVGRSDRLFSFALDNENIEIKKRVFMTATKKNAKHKSLEVYSMDNEKIYGKTAYDLSFRRAINLNLILDYKILITIITRQDLKREILKKTDSFGIDLIHHANAIAVQKTMETHGLHKMITFHNTIKNAAIFSETLKNYVDFESLTISSEQPKSERKKNMQIFRNSRKAVATNAKCLTEGIDVPEVDAVFFANDKNSVVDIVQAAGRTMRKSSGKTLGYIVLPIYLETFSNENFAEEIKNKEFDLVWSTLSALTEVDESLEALNTNLFNDLGRKHNITNFSKFIEIDTNIQIDKNLLIDAISTEAANNYVESFEFRIGQLQEFVENHGHGFVSLDYEDSNFANWAEWMRKSYRAKQLPLHKINKLKNNGFVFNSNEYKWYLSFNEYKKLKQNLKSDDDIKNPKIKTWVINQRQKIRKGELSQDKINQLRSIGFQTLDDKWVELYNYHKAIVDKYGINDIPQTRVATWAWVRKQKNLFDSLEEWQQKKLISLGVNQIVDKKSQVWLENFNDVFAYKAKNKTFPPAGYNGGKLSMWLRHQNKIFNTLSEEKRVKLLSIGFDKYIQESKIKVDKWQESYNAAFSYKKNHGKLPLFSENKTIYNWVNRQKNRMSNLKPDQVEKMLSLLY